MVRNSRRNSKHAHSQKSLHEFYSKEQEIAEQKEKKRKEHENIEMQIFEHLKQHTKKILKNPK